jgi:hypothetical protein
MAPRIACFISPHGYGHAARQAAIMAAVHDRIPDATFDIYTHVPKPFFADSLSGPFNYYPLLSDIGLVQRDALHEDVPETIRHLDELLPFDQSLIQQVAGTLVERETYLALCDIAPLGILIAEAAGIPSLLVENFTWDWIYHGYTDTFPGIIPHADYLETCFHRATYHVQTAPICDPQDADLVTAPVGRLPRTSPEDIRRQLGVAPGRSLVLVSMGGIPEQHGFVEALQHAEGVDFILPATTPATRRNGNVVELPHHSGFYHPDLVNASDCVIGKVGYSTIAEVYHCGVPFGYVSRPHFRESPPLASYIDAHIPSSPITPAEFRSGEWLDQLPDLLAMERHRVDKPNGADEVAAFIADRISS